VTTRATSATALRVLWQLRNDPRTIALLLVVPVLLLTLLRYAFDARIAVFRHIGAPMCGLYPFILMFLVTSIAMLRERTSGTLERLMSLPLAKGDLIGGYGLAFGLVAIVQASVVCGVGFVFLGLVSNASRPRTSRPPRRSRSPSSASALSPLRAAISASSSCSASLRSACSSAAASSPPAERRKPSDSRHCSPSRSAAGSPSARARRSRRRCPRTPPRALNLDRHEVDRSHVSLLHLLEAGANTLPFAASVPRD